MTAWCRRLVPVPTAALIVDQDIALDSPKGYSRADLQRIARTVPTVYANLSRGVGHAQLLSARSSGDSRVRALGDTYAHLFGATPSAELLVAESTSQDGRLAVQRGNHRVRAAQAAGVPFLPVEVRARTPEAVDALTAQWTREHGEQYGRLLDVHSALDRARTLSRKPIPGQRSRAWAPSA